MDFTLPDVGEGLTEATILTWRVSVGDVVQVNDVLLEIETAKSVVELPSPEAGRIEAILVDEGREVAVGTPLVRIAAASAESTASEPVVTATVKEPVLVGYGPRETSPSRRRRRRNDHETGNSVAQHSERSSAVSTLAKPPVRKLAKDLGVDLLQVPHDGPVITRSDVEAFAQGGSSADVDTIPVSGVRKAMAESMVDSFFTAPHATIWRETDVTDLMRLLGSVRARHPDAHATVFSLIAYATCRVLRDHPMLNARWVGDHIEIPRRVDLGFAVAAPRGLLVPHVPGASELDLPTLSMRLHDLTQKARAGYATPQELTGGTFSITNVGIFDVDGGTPILVPGQAGILATGRVAKKPWVVGDAVVPRDVTLLSLSFDHRVVDGQQAATFLSDLAEVLAQPALLALP